MLEEIFTAHLIKHPTEPHNIKDFILTYILMTLVFHTQYNPPHHSIHYQGMLLLYTGCSNILYSNSYIRITTLINYFIFFIPLNEYVRIHFVQ